jgi:hypothetical protein
MRITLCFGLLLVACGDNAMNNPDLAMMLDMAAPPGADLAFASACGRPGDTGNSIGVGKFCTGGVPDSTCPTNVCSHSTRMDTYFCTTLCSCGANPTEGMVCTDATCKEASVCQCTKVGMSVVCGCVPASCAMPQG